MQMHKIISLIILVMLVGTAIYFSDEIECWASSHVNFLSAFDVLFTLLISLALLYVGWEANNIAKASRDQTKQDKTEFTRQLQEFERDIFRNNYKKITDEFGINEITRFHGYQNEYNIAKIYTNSHCYICSSNIETFGISIVEALSAGLPVIATKCGGPDEYLDSETGYQFPVNDAAALADKIKLMLTNYNKFDPTQIREKMKIKFSESVFRENLNNIYNDILIKN